MNKRGFKLVLQKFSERKSRKLLPVYSLDKVTSEVRQLKPAPGQYIKLRSNGIYKD